MTSSKKHSLKEEFVLPRVARGATLLFSTCWLLGMTLLCWRVLPFVYGRDSVPLHYNIYVGIDAFGPWWMLGYVPCAALVMVGLNALLALVFLKKRPMLAVAVWMATAGVGILALLAIIRIVLINLAYG